MISPSMICPFFATRCFWVSMKSCVSATASEEVELRLLDSVRHALTKHHRATHEVRDDLGECLHLIPFCWSPAKLDHSATCLHCRHAHFFSAASPWLHNSSKRASFRVSQNTVSGTCMVGSLGPRHLSTMIAQSRRDMFEGLFACL